MKHTTVEKYNEYMNLFVKRLIDKDGSCYEPYEYQLMDKFVDEEIDNGGIVKHSQYNFTAIGLAKKVSELLKQHNMEIKDESESEFRNESRVKGQVLYFIVYKNDVAIYGLNFSWEQDGFHIGCIKNKK